MQVRSFVSGAAALILGLGIASAGCDVDKVEDGEMPEVDVDVGEGKMPEYDVDAPDVDVRAERKRVEVPDVDVDVDSEEREITVPDVDVDAPEDEP